MAQFDYKLALDLPREVVKQHIKNASASSTSQVVKRYRERNETAIVDLIEGIRKEIKLEAITASVNEKAQA